MRAGRAIRSPGGHPGTWSRVPPAPKRLRPSPQLPGPALVLGLLRMPTHCPGAAPCTGTWGVAHPLLPDTRVCASGLSYDKGGVSLAKGFGASTAGAGKQQAQPSTAPRGLSTSQELPLPLVGIVHASSSPLSMQSRDQALVQRTAETAAPAALL